MRLWVNLEPSASPLRASAELKDRPLLSAILEFSVDMGQISSLQHNLIILKWKRGVETWVREKPPLWEKLGEAYRVWAWSHWQVGRTLLSWGGLSRQAGTWVWSMWCAWVHDLAAWGRGPLRESVGHMPWLPWRGFFQGMTQCNSKFPQSPGSPSCLTQDLISFFLLSFEVSGYAQATVITNRGGKEDLGKDYWRK